MKKINLIIDGNNLIHRTYWQAKLNAKEEKDIQGLHILFTLRAVYHYASLYRPTNTWICWDERLIYEPTPRQELFTEYKANRNKENNNNVYANNQILIEIFDSMGIRNFYPRRLEADDCVAYLCDALDGMKVVVSVDKDFMQLIKNDVVVYSPIKKVEVTTENFEQHNDVSKEHFFLFKCLRGDKSDNVPGIQGMGPKRIKRYIDGKFELTEEQQLIVDRNKELFRLDKYKEDNEECDFYKQQCDQSSKLNWEQFLNLCERYELNSIITQKESWHDLFFMKNILTELFG